MQKTKWQLEHQLLHTKAATEAYQTSNEFPLTVLMVFTFTLTEITKIYTVYKTPS